MRKINVPNNPLGAQILIVQNPKWLGDNKSNILDLSEKMSTCSFQRKDFENVYFDISVMLVSNGSKCETFDL